MPRPFPFVPSARKRVPAIQRRVRNHNWVLFPPPAPDRATPPPHLLTGSRKPRGGKKGPEYPPAPQWLYQTRPAPTEDSRRPCKDRRVLHNSPPTGCHESPPPVRESACAAETL